MKMEDHNHNHNHHPIIHQYGITDLHHLIIPSLSQPNPTTTTSQPSFETLMMMNRPISDNNNNMIIPQLGLYHNNSNSINNNNNNNQQQSYGSIAAAAATPTYSGSGGGGGGGTGRWPRQETLTLLEIRSRLDSKFKEANQKGPLWDELSRIMSEEHGYQRSGKKCREKFENLYKYYKKTKEGKAGRQDGKHYRFFRQLEALYGETSNNNNNNNNFDNNNQISLNYNNLGFHAIPNTTNNTTTQEGFNNNNINNNNSLSLSNGNSSEFIESSSDDNESSEKNNSTKRRGWKAKIKEFVDSQMRRLMEKQEAWLEKLMRTLEQKERERSLRDEEWQRQEASRVEREHRFWAKERAWIEARDSALMEALKSLSSTTNPKLSIVNPSCDDDDDRDDNDDDDDWIEVEVSRLIEIRTGMESRFERGGFSEEVLWDDVATKMACLGFDRSSLVCKEKWERISIGRSNRNSKKRKENSRECGYGNNSIMLNNNESSTSLYNHRVYNENCDQMNNDGTSSSPNSNANVGNSSTSHDHHHHHHHHNHGHVVGHDGCFPFLMGEGSENLWESYGLKINKGGQS